MGNFSKSVLECILGRGNMCVLLISFCFSMVLAADESTRKVSQRLNTRCYSHYTMFLSFIDAGVLLLFLIISDEVVSLQSGLVEATLMKHPSCHVV